MRHFAHLLLLPLVISSVQMAVAQDTAYQALRTFGASGDQALLNRVIEVKGRNGSPQPQTWLIVIDDPKARGGIREVEISKGKISSERTPVQAYSGSAAGSTMDMGRLNLDSQGAFSVAEEEAKSAGISFDSVDYVLSQDSERGAPQWVLQLLDRNERALGTVKIAADDGAIVSRQFRGGGSNVASESKSEPPRETRSARRDAERRAERNANANADDDYQPERRPDSNPPTPRRSSRSTSRPATDYDTPIRSATGRNSHAPSRNYTERDVRRQPVKGREVEESGERPRDIGYRVDRRVHRIGGALQKFFTGRRTIDEKYREPYDNE